MKRAGVLLVSVVLIIVSILAAMLAFGTKPPPMPLSSISKPMRAIDYSDLPPRLTYTARDRETLSYRRYPGAGPRTVILIHGSSGESGTMHALAKALRADGITAYTPDLRGHAHDGTSGDIDHAGQLDDDLVDLLHHLGATPGDGCLTLIGHSSGGGFALRIAEGPYGSLFDHYVLLSPALAYDAPTTRPGTGGWAVPFVPRIVALQLLNRLGVTAFNGLPVIAFAVTAKSQAELTSTYSYRLLGNFSVPRDYLSKLREVRKPVALLVGAEDELFHADRYAQLLQPILPSMEIRVVPGVDHMGMILRPEAVAAILDAMPSAACRG